MYVPKFSHVLSVWKELVLTLINALMGERKLGRFPMQQLGFSAACKLICE
jgi:hypothetical protein